MTEIKEVSQDQLLKMGVCLLDEALLHLMEVKNEVGVDISNKVYKAIRTYEKYQEKKLKDKLGLTLGPQQAIAKEINSEEEVLTKPIK